MQFPGNRKYKLRRPVKANVITGELNFDGVFCLTHADFITYAPNAITLNHTEAMQQGGTDLAISADEEGATRLALQVVRCELSATAADSRVELWVRVPNVSDTIDTDVWLWWGDATETQPAVTADYGRDDVWNGVTGDGVPIVSTGVYLFDGDPTSPAPQLLDVTGGGNSLENNGTAATVVDCAPGRGWEQTATSLGWTGDFTWPASPGTQDFSIITVISPANTSTRPIVIWKGWETNYATWSTYPATVVGGANLVFVGPTTYTGSPTLTATVRDGDSIREYSNTIYDEATGVASIDCSGGGQVNIATHDVSTGDVFSLVMLLDCAPNAYWMRALYDNIIGTSIWDDTYPIAPAAVTAEIVFDSLNAGTEVRVYEQPHPQIWSFDLDGLTPANLALKYIQFQIQGESSTSEHYVWFRLDGSGTDPAPGGTGHRVDVATGDSASVIAAAAQAVLDVVTDLGATSSGSVVTVTNDRNGELATPADGGTAAEITLTQCGGTATDEIDGIESSTGTSWTASYSILRPRRATIRMLSIAYENVQYSAILTTAGLVVPAGALQREDRNYLNPT